VPSAAGWEPRLHERGASALYLHVPFCVRKCAYCDFASWETRRADPLMGAYEAALELEVEEAASAGLLARCATAYVGGGTPSLLGERLLPRLVSAVARRAPVSELTCEANPESLTDALAEGVRTAGCTRLSVGVQSLVDEELRALGRVHDAALARERVAAAVASGLDVSVDLMCATPRQTDASWDETLEGALGLGVGHVSVYPLAIEEGTALWRRYGDAPVAWNDPDVQARRMERAEELLGRAGLARYEVASYARPGRSCEHNVAYWTGRPYLGLGTHASSMLAREGYERLRRVATSLPALPAGASRVRLTVADGRDQLAARPSLAERHWDLELLDEGQAAAEDLMLGLRLSSGVGPALLEHARCALGRDRVDAMAEGVLARGLARETAGGGLAPTESGWLLGNELFGACWELAEGTIDEIHC
jgi:putative oxygen-independent coproporphyrinogen III oxidase